MIDLSHLEWDRREAARQGGKITGSNGVVGWDAPPTIDPTHTDTAESRKVPTTGANGGLLGFLDSLQFKLQFAFISVNMLKHEP